MDNQVSFKVWGRYALFTDPVTRTGGDKCSYQVPTYEAIKGILRSIYWKPTFVWVIDKVRIIKPIRTESKNIKPLKMNGGNSLAIYTYLADVEYQVEAHFEWSTYYTDETYLAERIPAKHLEIARRMIRKGGRRDIFLGSRECQGYVEECEFGTGPGAYDELDELAFGIMFHGFDYPDELGKDEFHRRYWRPVMRHGVIQFPPPRECTMTEFIRNMKPMPLKSSGLQEGSLQYELA